MHPRLITVIVLAAYAVIALVLFHDTWLTPGQTIAGQGNDPPMFVWYLKWTPWALAHGQNPLLTDYLVHPDGANLMWNTSLLLPAFLLWPVTQVFGPLVAYNLLMTAAPVLSAGVAFLALRRHASLPAAAIGAAVYAFCPMLIAHDYLHAQLTIAVFPPLALMLIEDIVNAASRRTAVRRGLLLGLAAAAQFLTGSELLAITVVSAAAGLLLVALLHREQVLARARALATGLGVAVAAFLVTAAVPLGFLLYGPQRISGPIQPQDVFVQDLAGLVAPSPTLLLTTPGSDAFYHTFTGNIFESSGYIGVPLLLALIVYVWLRRDRVLVRLSAALAVMLAVLALGPSLHVGGHVTHFLLPWALLQALPLLNNVVPARFMIPGFLAIGMLVALILDDVARLRRPRARIAVGVALAAVAVSLLPKPIPAIAFETPAFFTSAALERIAPGGVAVVVPFRNSVNAMVWQAQADMRYRMPSGRIFTPKPTPHLGPAPSPLVNELFAIEGGDAFVPLTGEQRRLLLDDMRRIGVTAVVVGPSQHAPEVVDLFSQLLGLPPHTVGGVQLWTDIHL
jgi:hypothetical protein